MAVGSGVEGLFHEPATPDPAVYALRPCTRYTRDSVRCVNLTLDPTGWCGWCDGFRRSTATGAPLAEPLPALPRRRLRLAPAKRAAAGGPVPYTPPGPVAISETATDAFRFHHGGPIETAEAELAVTLGAMLANSHEAAEEGPRLYLRRRSALLVVDRGGTVLDYATSERDRTPLQLDRGIKPRMNDRTAVTPRIAATLEREVAITPEIVADLRAARRNDISLADAESMLVAALWPGANIYLCRSGGWRIPIGPVDAMISRRRDRVTAIVKPSLARPRIRGLERQRSPRRSRAALLPDDG